MSTIKSILVGREQKLKNVIDRFPWSPEICEQYCVSYCAACKYLEGADIEEEDSSDEDSPTYSKPPEVKKPKMDKKIAMKKNRAEVVTVVENNHSQQNTPPSQASLDLDFGLLNKDEIDAVKQMHAEFLETGKVPELLVPKMSDKIFEKLNSMEKSFQEQLKHLFEIVARVDTKINKLEKQVSSKLKLPSSIFSILDISPVRFEKLEPSPSSTTTGSVVGSAIASVYTGLFPPPPSPGFLKLSSESYAACNSQIVSKFTPTLISDYRPQSAFSPTPVATLHTPERNINVFTPRVLKTASPRALIPMTSDNDVKPSAEVSWAELSETYAVDATAQRFARSISWEDDATTVTTLNDRSSPAYQFCVAVCKPGMDRCEFARHALRHVFPPKYFIGRNCSGIVPPKSKPKRAIHASTLRIILKMAFTALENDSAGPEKIKSSINKWLRDPTFLSKMSAAGL